MNIERFDWVLYRALIQYAVDTDPQRKVSGATSSSTIGPGLFVERMYVLREEFEASLIETLKVPGPIYYLAGGRGQGKTSAVYYARETINALPGFEWHAFVVDVRKVLGAIVSPNGNSTSIEARFVESFRNWLMHYFFRGDPMQVAAWTLAGPPDESEMFEEHLVTDFLVDHHLAIDEAGVASSLPRRERRWALFRYLSEKRGTKLRARWLEKIQKCVTMVHVLQAAIAVNPWKHGILIFDNVDLLPQEHQVPFVHVVESVHAQLCGNITLLVAIRPENLVALHRGRGAGANAMHVLWIPESRSGAAPDAGDSFLKDVLSRRHALGLEFSGGTRSGFVQSVPSGVSTAHPPLLGSLLSVRIHHLANENMRAVTQIYSEFIEYLDGLGWGSADDTGFMETMFCLWLSDRGPQFGILMHDVVAVGGEDGQSRVNHRPSASLHHLMLTVIFNMRKRGAPRFSDVFRPLRDLGFGLPQVLDALGELSGAGGAFPGSVRILDDGDVSKFGESSRSRLDLTLCGAELVGSFYSRVGYLWGRAYAYEVRHGDGGNVCAGEAYLRRSPPERIETLLRFLSAMARDHLRLMAGVRERLWPRHQGEWLAHYRAVYGVDSRLQIERSLVSASHFYQHRSRAGGGNVFNEFLARYSECLALVVRGEPVGGEALDDLVR